MPRDINRIDPFLKEIGTIWKTKCPNWRFGQLMFNLQRVMETHRTDIFFMEEDELLEYMKDWFDDEPKKRHDIAKRKRRKVCIYPERRKSIREKKEIVFTETDSAGNTVYYKEGN